ncbi:hypothetical protein BJ165DRAFT_183243 [Panaeolus papilionaceus]|nr:hypothetical protein BJ165DRAFT_183243 [Panaeolus papilionaceus]
MSLLNPDLSAKLKMLRDATPVQISLISSQKLPQELLPHTYINSLTPEERVFCHRASLVCWYATSKTQVPRKMQLRTMVAEIFHKNDVLVSAGTGSGKTLPVALAVLLQDPDDHRITITVSPLKRLQSTQANEFIKRYGIQTVVVNDTTSREDFWWNAHVFGNTKKNNLGKTAQIIISTVEQLFRSPEGHFSNLAEGLREKKHFQRRISRICVGGLCSTRVAGVGGRSMVSAIDVMSMS